MSLRINDTAPNFTAETTTGPDPLSRLDRRQLGDPVLAPEGLHAGVHHRARLHGEARARVHKRNRKLIGLSVDPVDDHERWAKDIEETQGHRRSTR